MSELLERLATALLTPDERARWRDVVEYLSDPMIIVLGSPETPAERLGREARQLATTIVRRTIAAVQDGRLTASGVPADDPLADPQPISANALAHAVQEDVANLDLKERRLLRGGRTLMIDLDVRVAPVMPKRKRGAPSKEAADKALFPEIVEMMRARGLTDNEAVNRIDPKRIAGGGVPHNKSRRLLGRFRKRDQ
jgi:hypothetical protein